MRARIARVIAFVQMIGAAIDGEMWPPFGPSEAPKAKSARGKHEAA